MAHKISFIVLISYIYVSLGAQVPRPIKQLLDEPYMKGASFSLIVKEIESGKTVFAYDTTRQLIPASVMKTLTTATALEILGEDYRYPTTLEYDGTIEEGTLKGNLYIKGSGDPTLGSSRFDEDPENFLDTWIAAIQEAGIQRIEGRVIADERIFDTEGTSLKWVSEDMGSYYGAGSYGLSVFENMYCLILRTGAAGSRPQILGTEPELSDMRFHNYLVASPVPTDSSFIVGAPFSKERYLYGIVPTNRERYLLKGDIPDPPLFLAECLTKSLEKKGISVSESPTCFRILQEAGSGKSEGRTEIITTYSPTLREIVKVTNTISHNLFADALIKTIGLQYTPRKGEILSSFNRGIQYLRAYWEEKGMDLSDLWMYDGSGLAPVDKVTTTLLANLLIYMRTRSHVSEAFFASLPQAGVEGSVRNLLKGSGLRAHLKSGSMSRVRCYAGYIEKGERQYAIALLSNNYACDGRIMTAAIERLLIQLFQ